MPHIQFHPSGIKNLVEIQFFINPEFVSFFKEEKFKEKSILT
jgi:hypothetical protein